MNRLLFSGATLLPAVVMTALVLAPPAQAAYYGNFSSTTGSVSFLDVQDVNGLFGAPVASANSLDFSPNMFEVGCPDAGASCPPATASVDDLLTFQIDANAGFVIEDIVLSEAGDTTINDFTLATGFAATTVVGAPPATTTARPSAVATVTSTRRAASAATATAPATAARPRPATPTAPRPSAATAS